MPDAGGVSEVAVGASRAKSLSFGPTSAAARSRKIAQGGAVLLAAQIVISLCRTEIRQ